VRPATAPRSRPDEGRLLVIDAERGGYQHRRANELSAILSPGDLLVVNDAATMPASLKVRGRDLEIRLVRRLGSDRTWAAVAFGAGDFRTPTERRAPPPPLRPGERLDVGGTLTAEVTHVDPELPRLIELRFDAEGTELWRGIYREGRPIQYAYLEQELPLWHFQNRFAARPWALELPSAGQLLTWDVLTALRARGVELAHVTHAAGISSTGSPEIDGRLPLPERSEIGTRAVRAVEAAKARRARIVAVGTTVVRALEARFRERGKLEPGEGEARLVIGPGFVPRVADSVLSGMHEPTTSHFALLQAFAGRSILEPALTAAEGAG
jgi:S-adenosylmethionine:tRNA ribosyltransferase-isomerase